MSRIPVHIALPAHDHLGEGPAWDERRGELVRVDITAGIVHRWHPASGACSRRALEPPVSFAVPRAAGDGVIVGAGREIRALDPDRLVATIDGSASDLRLNDAACDARGRLWAGTMSTMRRAGAAALYRVDPDGAVERVLGGTTISNGLAWSCDGQRMLFIDSTTQRVDVFDFDVDAGRVADRRPLIEIAPADGLPDGMAIDAEDGIWMCLFGGAAVRRYSADGRLDAVVELPVSNPTSLAFGGDDLRTLYVTTARHRLSPEQLAREPLAGSVLALEPGVAGLPTTRFAG